MSGKTEQGSPQYYLDLAVELRIPIDTYELAPSPGAPLSIKKSLAINTVERCHVTVAGCGRPDIQDSSVPFTGAAFLASLAHNNANLINGSNQGVGVAPFAVLTPRSKVPGSCELKILPFNYPIILPIIKKATDQMKKCALLAVPGSKVFSHPWVDQVKKELGAYLHTVPTYVYPCVAELLRYIGLEQLTKQIISKQKEERIHRNPFKTIQAMRGIAIAGNVCTDTHTHTLSLSLSLSLFLSFSFSLSLSHTHTHTHTHTSSLFSLFLCLLCQTLHNWQINIIIHINLCLT